MLNALVTFRWGILSTGRIAADFTRDLVHIVDAEITAVASRDIERARRFASGHGIARAHGSAEALAADPDVDIVYVAGIHPVHRDHAIATMRAGKHVLVEKPLAMNEAEVTEMTAVSRATGRFLMEAMWMRFNPLHVELRRRADEGEFGPIVSIESDFSFAAPDDPTHRLFDPAKGGGAMLDVGVYPITLAWWWLGEPASWDASVTTGPTGVDVGATLELAWDSGVTARLTCGTTRNGPRTSTIVCEGATIVIPDPGHASPLAEIRRGDAVEVLRCDPPGLHHQVREVHRCLAGGAIESPSMPHDTSRAIAGFIDAVLRRALPS